MGYHEQYKKFIDDLPRCKIKSCGKKVTFGGGHGNLWVSKYCKTHGKQKKKHALKQLYLGGSKPPDSFLY